jgi:hypothetical protein
MVNAKCIALFAFLGVMAALAGAQHRPVEIEGSPAEIAEIEALLGKKC